MTVVANRLGDLRGEVNALTRARERLRASGISIVDLTESNPTRVGLPYPSTLLESLADPAALAYAPDPLGLPSARAAIAGEFARRGVTVDPGHLVLSASTSEAYSWLFKLLCDPGDTVLVPAPSYPLFEHLTRLEAVRAQAYPLEFHGRWTIDVESIAAAPASTRALLVVSPNNPTGSMLTRAELEALTTICRERSWALIVDEVFVDYRHGSGNPAIRNPEPAATDVAAAADVLCFTLGGASKSLGLPQVKLGWTLVGGPAAERDRALMSLELIADTFLSVGTPVQVAAPRLLREAAPVRAAIQERLAVNLSHARAIAARHPACTLYPIDAGWTIVVRVPATRSEEAIVLDLLEREHVLVHPGYFFDFASEAFLVCSLLPEPAMFADAFERVLQVAA